MSVHTIENTEIIAYHGDCPDGFTAYWVLKRFLVDAEGVACTHGRELDVTPFRGKAVTFVDFCPPINKLKEVIDVAESVYVLDHHETAMKACMDEWDSLGGFDGTYEVVRDNIGLALRFDMTKSGAGLAWAERSSTHLPSWVAHVQDRDLWAFKLPGTADVFAAVTSRPYTLEAYDEIDTMGIKALKAEGRAIERYRQQLVGEAVARRYVIKLDGTEVWVTNCVYAIGSEVGGRLAEMNPAGVGAYYVDTAIDSEFGEVSRRWGLRSRKGGPNVAELASRLDSAGGGHAAASGFGSTYFLDVPGTDR